MLDITTAIVVSFYQRTPLHLAARQGHDDTVECLVEREAKICVTDNRGVNVTTLLADSRNELVFFSQRCCIYHSANMPFENSLFFFVNGLRREKDMYHFKLKTITKGILNLHTIVCCMILQLLLLFLSVSGLPCIWQQEKAVRTL